MKNKNWFIISNPNPHYVHKTFADSISPIYINNLLYKKSFFLIPFFTIISFIINIKKIINTDSFLLVWWNWIFISYLIKLFFNNKKIILLNADPFFYDLDNKNWYIKNFYIKTINKLDWIICNSKINLKYAKKYYKKKNIDYVFPFIRENILKYKNNNINKNTENYIYIWRESKEKNIDKIINFCNNKKKKLYIVGYFSKKTIKKYWSEFIIFLWYKNEKELIKLSKTIKCGFLLSNYDSFWITPIEYVKLWIIPIISSNVWSKDILNNKDIIVWNFEIKEIDLTISKLNALNTKELLNQINKNIDSNNLNKLDQVNKFKYLFNKFIWKKII